MKKPGVILAAILLLSAAFAGAQERVPLITLNKLEQRLGNGGDTTFVINLWATWCAPCVSELPHFERLQQTYASKPLRVLLVSLDRKEKHDAVVNFIESKGLKSEVLLLDEKDEQYFIPKISQHWSGAIPATLFVNTQRGIQVFREQEFDYEQLENDYLSIVHQNN